MSDRKLDPRALEAVSEGIKDYPSRVRSLLGIPRPDLTARSFRLAPSLDALPFNFPVHTTDFGRTAVYGGQPVDASPALGGEEAPLTEEAAAFTEEADNAAAAQRLHVSEAPEPTQVNADTRAHPEREARSLPSNDPWQFGSVESKIRGVGPDEPSHLEARRDRSSLGLDEERTPPHQVLEESSHTLDASVPAPTDHAYVAIPGGPPERENPAVEFQTAETAAFPVDTGKGAEAVSLESPVQPPAFSARAVRRNGYDAAFRGSDRDADPASTQTSGPRARPLPAISELQTGVSREPEFPRPSRAPGGQTRAGDSVRRAHAPSRPGHAVIGFEQAADREVDAAVRAVNGVRAKPSGIPGSKAPTRTVEEPVHVPTRDHRELARLEKKVERLEARMDRQRADLRETARAEAGTAPRFVFIAGRPAAPPAAPRAYWARNHLGRQNLRPRC